MTRRQKEAQKRKVPDYIFNDEELKYYLYCIRNGIIISPMGTKDNAIGKWRIGISTPDNHKKVYYAPHIYDKDTLWPSLIDYFKFYYEKEM